MEVNIWDLILNFVLAWFIFKMGQWSIIWPIRSALRRALSERGLDLDKILREEAERLKNEEPAFKVQRAQERRINIEKVQGQYYAYAADGGDFLAQGHNFEEMFLTIKQRFPDSTWRIDRDVPGLTTEEVGQMTQTIFRVFGDRNDTTKT